MIDSNDYSQEEDPTGHKYVGSSFTDEDDDDDAADQKFGINSGIYHQPELKSAN